VDLPDPLHARLPVWKPAAPASGAVRRWLARIPWLVIRVGQAGGGRAVGPLSAWLWWEAFTTRWWRSHSVASGGLTRYRLVHYAGRPVRLSDGTVVQPGDLIVELHLDNPALASSARQSDWSPWRDLHKGAVDLQTLDARIQRGEFGRVQALRGITLLATVGRRLGFEVRPLAPTWHTSLLRYFFVGLDAIYHPRGLARLDRHLDRRWPVEMWMSAAALHARAAAARDQQPQL
jgi:hypothetical protein